MFGIALKPVLHIFGENFLESLAESGDCDGSANNLFQNCKLSFLRPVVALILFLAYATLVNLMLVNLLIAVFTNTYTLINDNLDQYWNMIFYRVAVKYYRRKNNYPGPIFVVMFVTELFVCGFHKSRKCIKPLESFSEDEAALKLEHKQNQFRAKMMEQMTFHNYFVLNDQSNSQY